MAALSCRWSYVSSDHIWADERRASRFARDDRPSRLRRSNDIRVPLLSRHPFSTASCDAYFLFAGVALFNAANWFGYQYFRWQFSQAVSIFSPASESPCVSLASVAFNAVGVWPAGLAAPFEMIEASLVDPSADALWDSECRHSAFCQRPSDGNWCCNSARWPTRGVSREEASRRRSLGRRVHGGPGPAEAGRHVPGPRNGEGAQML